MRLKEIEKIEWIKTVTRPMFLYGQISQTEGERDSLEKKVGSGIKNKILFPSESGHIQYFSKEDWKDFSVAVSRQLKKKNSYRKYIEDVEKQCEEFEGFLLNLSSVDLSSKTNKEIFKYYEDFENYRSQFAYVLYPPLVIEKTLEDNLREELQRVLQKEKKEYLFDKYFEVITTKTGVLNESDKEERELLKIAEKYSENDIKKHAEKYTWIPYYGYGLPLGTTEYFKQQIEDIKNPRKELEKRKKDFRNHKRAFINLRKELAEYVYLSELIDLTQDFLYLRQYRTEILRKAYYYPRQLLKEISKRMKISLDNSFFLLPSEIKEFFVKEVKPSMDMLEERKNSYAIVMVNGDINVVSSIHELEDLEQILLENEVFSKTILNGTGIYKGVVEGTVRNIKDIREISKIKNGDILVTTMTTPEMYKAINKIVGIITDEGGLTCHAAIISRELHVPCVIGTGNATKILHDNDLVILDSERGVVKIQK